MDELLGILRPTWGAEQWIYEGWNKITTEEKEGIKKRITALFAHGLPFKMQADRLLYINVFAFLAQLEVLAIQVPLKFEAATADSGLRKLMRQQLVDEIFHGMVFTKILYLLCAPNALPPEYNPTIESLCDFIRNENCPKVAFRMLNLIAEGWIEETFKCLHRFGVAAEVFQVILEDEHRHVQEADLYHVIGTPNHDELQSKVAYLEERLITVIFMNYNYNASLFSLIGAHGVAHLKNSLHQKHVEQIKKIGLKPSTAWAQFIQLGDDLLPQIQNIAESFEPRELTPTRKVFMSQWKNPADPTMVGHFGINVSCLDFFEQKNLRKKMTFLMLQAISLYLSSTDSMRQYLSSKRVYQCKEAYTGLVVKLPDCGNHLAIIVFKNCHTMSYSALSAKIHQAMHLLSYCYKKREELEQNNPIIQKIMHDTQYAVDHATYNHILPDIPFVSVSNIGSCGYTQGSSPLFPNEAVKFTLMDVERKPVWSRETNSFLPEDILPVSISADHRIYDANIPIPKPLQECFDTLFSAMMNDKSVVKPNSVEHQKIDRYLDQLLATNLTMGYNLLVLLQSCWFDFLSFEDIVQRSKQLVPEVY